ncbi:hypothetical protein GOODEAATRI_026046 [Goodea atripinnis]|uniref:Uncharacterized protein n=1 Tax=Goodea atripinnis TaxID=208336 RepID=A0ABV0NEP3_9TELE
MSTWEDDHLSVAVFMKSPSSLESPPLKVRERMTMKGVEVLTVSWATAGKDTDKGLMGVPEHLQTLEKRTAIKIKCVFRGGVTYSKLHCCFSLVSSESYKQA